MTSPGLNLRRRQQQATAARSAQSRGDVNASSVQSARPSAAAAPGQDARAQRVAHHSGISDCAPSGPSDPWMTLRPTFTARSARTVPGAEASGFVAPGERGREAEGEAGQRRGSGVRGSEGWVFGEAGARARVFDGDRRGRARGIGSRVLSAASGWGSLCAPIIRRDVLMTSLPCHTIATTGPLELM